MAAFLKIVAVYDGATKAYGRPVFVPHVGAAVRSFVDEVHSKESELGKHPTDYELFELGEFDEEKGVFINLAGEPRSLMRGADVLPL